MKNKEHWHFQALWALFTLLHSLKTSIAKKKKSNHFYILFLFVTEEVAFCILHFAFLSDLYVEIPRIT